MNVYAERYGVESVYNRAKQHDVVGWHISVSDADIDATAELITQLATTYAQLAAEDEVEVLSSAAGDITQTITVFGINNNGKYVSEDITINTTAGTTATTSSTIFRYIDYVESDLECAGTITVRRETGDTFITSIPIGQLNAGMAQHFNGECVSYITDWKAQLNESSSANPIDFELRWYPDDADCLDAGDGYIVLDRGSAFASGDTIIGGIEQPIRCPAGGWIAAYGTGNAANASGSVKIQGYDVR